MWPNGDLQLDSCFCKFVSKSKKSFCHGWKQIYTDKTSVREREDVCLGCGGGIILGAVGRRCLTILILLACAVSGALALDPRKSPTQYSRTTWNQERGLPHDTIRAITQTGDGYLWLGTDEGLARFDGYEFVVFNKSNGDLPDNSITALTAANDGSLWIGTQNGLTQYRDGRFRTFTTKQGLPDS